MTITVTQALHPRRSRKVAPPTRKVGRTRTCVAGTTTNLYLDLSSRQLRRNLIKQSPKSDQYVNIFNY